MKKQLAACAVIASCVLGVTALLYLVVAIEVFQWRHPKANSRAGWLHPITVLKFGTIPEFQEGKP